jgi:haloalkane dehalogenase
MKRRPAWVDSEAYPFEDHYAELRDGTIHYVDEGHGETVLLVHGTPTWSFEYRHVIAALRDRFRCIAPDHLGFGLSDRPTDADYSPEAHAQRLRELVDALELDRFVLVVHDFGGPIGLPLALSGDGRVTRVVLVNTWMWPFDDDPQMRKRARIAGGALGRWLYRWANASLKLLMPGAYADRRKLTARIHGQYLAPFPRREDRERVLWALARALLGSTEHYRDLWERRAALRRLPTAIVWGLGDTAFGPNQLERWREVVPEAEITALESAGHWPHEEEPDAFVHALEQFLTATARDHNEAMVDQATSSRRRDWPR